MMLKFYLVNFVNLLANALMILIFARVLLSWLPTGLDRFRKVIFDLTEPFLAPLRKLVPPIGGMLDLSPIVAFVILQIVQSLVARI